MMIVDVPANMVIAGENPEAVILESTSPPTIEPRAEVKVIDRLIPPVMMTTIIAIAKMPNSGSWYAIDCMFLQVRNVPGDSKDMRVNTPINIRKRTVSLFLKIFSLLANIVPFTFSSGMSQSSSRSTFVV